MQILYLEDDPNDAELVQATLETGGVACNLTRVDNEPDFLRALQKCNWDVVLSDYTVPSFDGLSALRIAKELHPEVPFIFVSGTLGEELAIEALRLGATDYVFKRRLSRITPSVQRAVREAEERSRRKQIEQALRRSEAYLAEAQKLSHTGSFSWHVTNGQIYWSEETFRIFGYAPGTQPTLEQIVSRTHPDDRPDVQAFIERVTRDRESFDFEHRLLMPDGAVKYLQVVGHPSTDADGNFEFVGAVTDISEAKRAEQELQQVVDFVPQVIVVLSQDGRLIHANRVAREYTGLTVEQYRTAHAILRLIHPDDREQMRAARESGFRDKEPFEVEARLLGQDRVYRWFLFRYNPLVEQNAVRRWYGTATEIESRKLEEQRVRDENLLWEERTRIAQELHDTLLQTFVSASMQLTVALDLVPQDLEAKALLDRILQIMNLGIQEGRNTIQDLRSPESSGKDLVQALSRVQHEVAPDSGIKFRVKVTGEQRPLRPAVWHDVYRIGREALLNAFSHAHANSVEFELECSENQLRMRIRDDGQGFYPEVLESSKDRHWGLVGMRERADRIGAHLAISATTAGTDVQLDIPSAVAFPS